MKSIISQEVFLLLLGLFFYIHFYRERSEGWITTLSRRKKQKMKGEKGRASIPCEGYAHS